jgi:hypothetical protein
MELFLGGRVGPDVDRENPPDGKKTHITNNRISAFKSRTEKRRITHFLFWNRSL